MIKIPDLLILATMKAFALGRWAKWKNYVDIYFIGKKYGIKKIAQKEQAQRGSLFFFF